jgi:hypothetical protein
MSKQKTFGKNPRPQVLLMYASQNDLTNEEEENIMQLWENITAIPTLTIPNF